ncbi:PAS domain-containing hybrid sensor histidine kinase/response regulator [Solidesulfovibrio fructosivorans]|nr:ATP-binding protein [Solidesulfovibrio fructosivorans]
MAADSTASASPSADALKRQVAALEALVSRLRLRQERCELFFERSVMGILLGDNEGNLFDANPRALELLGYTLEEIRAANIRDLIHPDDMRMVSCMAGPMASLAGLPFTIERRYRRKDGTWLPVQVDFSPLDDTGQCFQAMLQDISARRAAEDAKNAALSQVRSASQAKSAFLANMSHEIRTPLNGVMGMLQLLLATPHSPEQDEYMRTAMDAASALLRLLSDILDFSSLDGGTMSLSQELFTVSDVLDPIIASFAHEAAIKGLAFSCRVAPQTPARLRGDPARLRQLLYNLTGNAIKYTTFGRVELDVAPVEKPESPCMALLEFAVRDTGIGIPSEKLDHVLDAFAQADASVTRAHGGLGLGLTIVRAIAERMGGRILLSSQPGQGTEARVRLPFARPPEMAPPVAPSAKPCLIGRRVLVVEDEAVNRLTIQAMLRRLGCETVLTENGREALARLAGEDFDCVLMDVRMPLLDGLSATRAVRDGSAGARNPAIPILALTAHALTEDREQALAAGVDGYVVKPVDLEALARAMDAVIPECREEA